MEGGPIIPTVINASRVLLYTEIDDRHEPTGACRHIAGAEELGVVEGLAICEPREGSGFFLYYCGDDFIPLTDTWHLSVADAKRQAESEYRGVGETWEIPPG